MVLYVRKWYQMAVAPTPASALQKPHIQIYDGGDTIGWLREGTWSCWRVLERKQTVEGAIQETLEEMPEDWCPFFVASVESYPVVSESSGALELPGWRITTSLA